MDVSVSVLRDRAVIPALVLAKVHVLAAADLWQLSDRLLKEVQVHAAPTHTPQAGYSLPPLPRRPEVMELGSRRARGAMLPQGHDVVNPVMMTDKR